MKGSMSCHRAEELLSDHLEGTLGEPLLADLTSHLARCEACRVLRETLEEVVRALCTQAAVEPPADLAERAATAAWVQGRLPRPIPLSRPSWKASFLPLPLAAALVTALSTTLLLAAPGSDPVRAALRLAERTVTAREYLLERKDRLVEDIRILRVVIATALEGRLDRVNDRVDDYRRLMERRPGNQGVEPHRRGRRGLGSDSRVAERSLGFQNFQQAGAVVESVRFGGRS